MTVGMSAPPIGNDEQHAEEQREPAKIGNSQVGAALTISQTPMPQATTNSRPG